MASTREQSNQAWALLFLRLSLGFLLIIWGIDKAFNVEHSTIISDHFYYGAFTFAADNQYLGIMTGKMLLFVIGVLEIAFGFLILLGMLRSVTYPMLAIFTGFTLLAVHRSVIDPWGWYLSDTNELMYPSLIVFASTLVLNVFMRSDRLSFDRIISPRQFEAIADE